MNKPTFKTKLVLVTPAKATEWLQNNTKNRRLRPRYVERLASDMTSGKYIATHQGVAFGTDGILVDGQHRLEAIVLSGTSQWLLVTTDLPPQALLVVDDGVKRSMADVVGIMDEISFTDLPRATSVATAIAGSGTASDGNGVKRTKAFQHEYMAKHQKAIQWALTHFPSKARGLGRSLVLAVVARAYYTQPKERLARFCEVLMTGTPNTAAEISLIKLRDYLMRSDTIKVGHKAATVTYRIVEAHLNAFLNNKVLVRNIQAANELFLLPGEKLVAAANVAP